MFDSLIRRFFPSTERFWEVFRFLVVGGGCFLLEYFLLYTLTEYGGLDPLVSAPIAFTVSLVVNYILCVYVVFHAEKQTGLQMALFVLTSLMGLGNCDDMELFHQALCASRPCVIGSRSVG